MSVRNPTHCPPHPGALLRQEIVPATGWSKTKTASLLGISRQHLYDILGEKKPVSAEVAARLAKMFRTEVLFWVRMQGAYDAWHATKSVDVSAVPEFVAG